MAKTETAHHASDAAGGYHMDPLHQFDIVELLPIELGGYKFSFTNSSLMMVLAVVLVLLLIRVGTKKRALIPDRFQCAVEMLYEFVADMVRSSVGNEGRRYFPFVFTIFMIVLMGNMLGLVPYAFTFTSHIIVTGTLALLVFFTVTAIGFVRHGLKFFHFFLPHGVPLFMAPLIIPIEIVSYLARPFSLSVRLFANMLSGHLVLKIIAGFSVMLASIFGLFGIVPMIVNVAFTGFEVMVAVLQAYIFTILTCLYLKDSIDLH